MDFMTERITEDAGKSFSPTRYVLKSKNDAVVKPYATYDLFFEITFHVLQKLGTYEDIGTPEECRKAMEVQTDDIEKIFTCNCDGCENTDTDECIHCMRAYSDCYEERRTVNANPAN